MKRSERAMGYRVSGARHLWAAGILFLVAAGCRGRRLTADDYSLCIRPADFQKCGWDLSDFRIVEKASLDYHSPSVWTVQYHGAGYDEDGYETFTIEFTVTCGPLVERMGWERSRSQMEARRNWITASNLVQHTSRSFAFHHVRGRQTNALMACWMQGPRMFRLAVGGLPILTAEEFDRLVGDKTNGWTTWVPGASR